VRAVACQRVVEQRQPVGRALEAALDAGKAPRAAAAAARALDPLLGQAA
jgi:hypothetical protein